MMWHPHSCWLLAAAAAAAEAKGGLHVVIVAYDVQRGATLAQTGAPSEAYPACLLPPAASLTLQGLMLRRSAAATAPLAVQVKPTRQAAARQAAARSTPAAQPPARRCRSGRWS